MEIVLNALLEITSPAFDNHGTIPIEYTGDGKNISPELRIGNLPSETKSLALIMEDSDAPTFVHWIMWNIPPGPVISENYSPTEHGINVRQNARYQGPCPPAGMVHQYHFRIFALDGELELPISIDNENLLKAIDGHVLGAGEIIGNYKRSETEK